MQRAVDLLGDDQGLPTVNSKPSRRIISTSTANCSSPRPCTSHMRRGGRCPRPEVRTLPINSESSRFLISRAVILLPCPPARGDVLVPMVTESRLVHGDHRQGPGSFGSTRVSPMVISGIPATAMMSPGPAWSTACAPGVGHEAGR